MPHIIGGNTKRDKSVHRKGEELIADGQTMKHAHNKIVRLTGSPMSYKIKSKLLTGGDGSGLREEEYSYFSQVTLSYLPSHSPYIFSNMPSIFIQLAFVSSYFFIPRYPYFPSLFG